MGSFRTSKNSMIQDFCSQSFWPLIINFSTVLVLEMFCIVFRFSTCFWNTKLWSTKVEKVKYKESD